VVDLRRAPTTGALASHNTKQFVAANVTYDEQVASNANRPSATIGTLVDPHGTSSESSPVLARTTPHSLPSPLGDSESQSDPATPAQFASDGPAYPITGRT